MIPIRDNRILVSLPLVTFTLIVLNVLIYLWDRQWLPFGPSAVFADLAMRPIEVMGVLRGDTDRFPLVTIFTSMFLHGGPIHVFMNMVYLIVFGGAVEQAFGGPRFALYYLFWGVAAGVVHILVDPGSPTPTLGASGAIGGVLGCYFLLFPANKIEILLPFSPIVLPAWVVLGGWILIQLFVRQEGVANWAHAGGFFAGMVTVLVAGGRKSIVKGREQELEIDLD